MLKAPSLHKSLTLLLGGLVFCAFLFSACGSDLTVSAAPSTKPSLLTQNDTLQLQTYQEWISLLKQYGGDATAQQKNYDADKQALQSAQTDTAYKAAQKSLYKHIEAIKIPALKAEITWLRQQLHQKVSTWNKTHTYTDKYDGVTYALAYEYDKIGIDGTIEEELGAAQTVADYQFIASELHAVQSNFDAMVDNASDKTPYSSAHKTDLRLLEKYHVMDQKVVVISLYEQAVRVYDQGQVVKAFLTTTGRPSRPSLPGKWQVEVKQAPTVFKSGVPVGSPDYYPDTPINYAMQYHSNGYFIHDSYWRADYGPGTNFPHQDSTGSDAAATGSHGCVNLPTDQAAWIYNFVEVGTTVIVY